MKILIITEDKINVFDLPRKVTGNVWITNETENGNTKNLFNIEARDDSWYLISNNEYYGIVDSKKVDFIKLEKNTFYMIKETESDKIIFAYYISSYEKDMKYYQSSTALITGITIGKKKENIISYNCHYVNDSHAQIILKEDKIILNDLNSSYGVYVNNYRIRNNAIIEYGDVIFIYGLKLIVLKINGMFIIGINNPNDLVRTSLEEINIYLDKTNETFDETNEEKDISLYSQNDYFHKKPRYIYSIREKELLIDSPPTTVNQQKMPMILTVGPMMTMSLTSGVMVFSSISSIQSGQRTFNESLPSLITSSAMMVSFLVWPILTNAFQKHLEKKAESKKQKKYNEYIENKKKEILDEKADQERILRRKYPSLTECSEIISKKEERLWEKRYDDNDFLNVSLGMGSFPMKLKLKLPEEHFSVEDDILKNKLNELNDTDRNLTNVPFEYSFKENFISSIVGEENLAKKLIKNIILQLVTFHSYDNLKIAIFTTKKNEKFWDEFKILPHLWSNDKTVRYYATEAEEYKELSYNLERIFSKRKEERENNNSNETINYNPVYLIFTDSFQAVRNIEFINNVIEEKTNLGFSILISTDKIAMLPNQCQTFIQLSEDISHVLRNVATTGRNSFKIDDDIKNLYEYFKVLSNIPIEINDGNDGAIPKKVGFLEMYDVGKIEQLNSLSRWKKNVPINNMNAIVGIGRSGEKIGLDLHEKFHGPHGLIAGMTGSGKSEFIITYILSLAINYHPEEVQFILIDYKGGGLAGAFENKTLGYKLPHLVGVITNLDKTEINRSLASIESELKRRQALFNKARELSGESTIDIYKYQKMYRNHIVDEPVSHLLIIADEFAELKTQQPEFMEQLISTARIGRSLGVHLILATQKPSGVVDAQIWSNTRFRVCLRVQEKSDSMEVIQSPDAAFLTQTGRFYLQVGYNEIYELGQSAWSGGKYIPSETIKKSIDSSINFVNNIGYVLKNVETKEETINITENKGEELTNIVSYLSNCALEEQIKTKPLWLEKIPAFIYVKDLIEKYNYTKDKYNLNPIIGEYDIPNKQKQELLTLSFSNRGNTIVYGMAGSGKENFITTIIYSSMLTYTPNEVNYYILDFGAEILKYFSNTPIVGDIVYINEEDKVKSLFRQISSNIQIRKKLFSNYNGDYDSYIKTSGNQIPNIVVIINNYEAFNESYPDESEKLIEITRDCIKYGIFFMLTCNTPEAIRFKLKQNFGNLFSLQQNNEDDYVTVLGNVDKFYPSKIFGRGIIKNDGVFEFQTAYVTNPENIADYIKTLSSKQLSYYETKAKRIPVLPETVNYDEIKHNSLNNEIIIGLEKNELEVSKIDFTKRHLYVISSQDLILFENFLNPFIKQYKYKNNINVIVINAEDLNLDNDIISNFEYYNSKFDEVVTKLKDQIKAKIDIYKNSNFDKTIFNNEKKTSCIIIGLNSFINKLSNDNQNSLDQLFNDGSDIGLFNFIILDTVDKFKNYQYDSWFKSNVLNTDGIWLGNGISEQYLFNITKRIPEMKNDVEPNFCFVINRGKPELVKYIEDIN